MKLGKVHVNIGTEENPKGLCGHKGKYMGYANKEVFDNDLGYQDKCMFCMYKSSDTSFDTPTTIITNVQQPRYK